MTFTQAGCDAVLDVRGGAATGVPSAASCAPDAAPGAVPGAGSGAAPSAAPGMGRRAFCALGAACLLGLAGCASGGGPDGGAGSGGPGGESGDGAATDVEGSGDASADASAGGAAEGSSGDSSDVEAEVAAEDPVKLSTFAFNTLVSLTCYGVSRDDALTCLSLCSRYEDLFSARKEGTDIARVNAAGGEPVEVDPDTADLLGQALRYGDETGGRFDVTIGSVSLLWDFVEGVKPADADVEAALAHVDYTKVRVEGTSVVLEDPLAKIDLGGIAKGWIAARLVERLQEAGATAALVNLGTSSIYALGKKPAAAGAAGEGSPWRIGLRDPKDGMGSLLGVVEVCDTSVTSSGLYDQVFQLDGASYWHILDPKTGYPVETDLLGDTLVCDDPVRGDALSTTMFSLGVDGAAAWLASDGSVAAMLVDDADVRSFVNGFEERCSFAPSSDASGDRG